MADRKYISTFTGLRLHFLSPQDDEIDIRDIAHGLSGINRFAAQLEVPYTVSEHSVYVANLIRINHGSIELQLAGLLHDAAEAYMSDVPRPIKNFIEGFDKIEDLIIRAVASKFDLPIELFGEVMNYDLDAYKIECRDVKGVGTLEYPNLRGEGPKIVPLNAPLEAELRFLRHFIKLTSERK